MKKPLRERPLWAFLVVLATFAVAAIGLVIALVVLARKG